jgi:DNA-directed RNA polymerase subunit RPC12/RpoP
MKERQELWCHECQRYVQFDIDVELNGNHVIVCPNCGHEHCRVVRNGVVTEARWDNRNVNMQSASTYMATGATSTNASTYATYSGTGVSTASTQFTYGAWMNMTGNS